ncbi:MAG: UDP-glucose/GDP-mannose dehydrogenase family protein [Candidatus Woesearchaeota archaeon]|jgi:UDPglucose 6-dehydrogenase|nr:UDP-glucose/GDP-mannose dehydrogenase family protein [Candidatus Woesearchaeota archaeon]
MNISIIGTGYVGLTLGVCLAELGNDVLCLDIDEEKINKLKSGILPIYEPGLKDMMDRNIKESRLSFTTNKEETIKKSTIIFIAVGTPPGENHEADLTAVRAVAKDIGTLMEDYKVIVDKSTVPVGTADEVGKIIKENQTSEIEFDVVSNPEFLREGEAVNDFLNPDRVVIGVENEKAKALMESIYKGIMRTDKPILFTDVKSAEMIKYASNAMLATRISFMNEVAQLCEKVGADVKMVAKGMGLDSRIGPRFLQAGVGYGGSCFPKDVQAFMKTMEKNGVEGKLLRAVEDINEKQKKHLTPKIKQFIPDLKGKKIAIWGLAFKPKTDDMREAPSISIIKELQSHGAEIHAFDPEAQHTAKNHLKDITYYNCPYETIKDAHALVIATEWNEFRNLDKEKLKQLLKEPNIIDGRNIYEPDEMKALGFNYKGVGR